MTVEKGFLDFVNVWYAPGSADWDNTIGESSFCLNVGSALQT